MPLQGGGWVGEEGEGCPAGGTASRCCPCPAAQASPPAKPAGHAAPRAPHCSVTGVGPRDPVAGAGRATKAHGPSPPRRRLGTRTAPRARHRGGREPGSRRGTTPSTAHTTQPSRGCRAQAEAPRLAPPSGLQGRRFGPQAAKGRSKQLPTLLNAWRHARPAVASPGPPGVTGAAAARGRARRRRRRGAEQGREVGRGQAESIGRDAAAGEEREDPGGPRHKVGRPVDSARATPAAALLASLGPSSLLYK